MAKKQMNIDGQMEDVIDASAPGAGTVTSVGEPATEKKAKRSRLEIAAERLEDAKLNAEIAANELRSAELQYAAAERKAK